MSPVKIQAKRLMARWVDFYPRIKEKIPPMLIGLLAGVFLGGLYSPFLSLGIAVVLGASVLTEIISSAYFHKVGSDSLPSPQEVRWPKNTAIFPSVNQNAVGVSGRYHSYLHELLKLLKQPHIPHLEAAQSILSRKGYRIDDDEFKKKSVEFPVKLQGWQKSESNPNRFLLMVWDPAEERFAHASQSFWVGLKQIYGIHRQNIHLVPGKSLQKVQKAFNHFCKQVNKAPAGEAEVLMVLHGHGGIDIPKRVDWPIPRKEGDLPYFFGLKRDYIEKPDLYAMARCLEMAKNVYILLDSCHSGGALNVDEQTRKKAERLLLKPLYQQNPTNNQHHSQKPKHAKRMNRKA